MSQGVFVSVTRQNAWELGSHWVEPILWYARGVKAMKARAIDDPLIWRFWRAIHGFDQARWQALGYWNPGAPTNFAPYGDQCQHGSWYFLPRHRGYVLAFEAVVRTEVVKLGGNEDWALPYWNYFKANQDSLPLAFASQDWPDGPGDNPLICPSAMAPTAMATSS